MTDEFMANIRLQCLQMATGGGSLMARDDAEAVAARWAAWVLGETANGVVPRSSVAAQFEEVRRLSVHPVNW